MGGTSETGACARRRPRRPVLAGALLALLLLAVAPSGGPFRPPPVAAMPPASAVAPAPVATCEEIVAAWLLVREAWLWVFWFDDAPVFEGRLAQQRPIWEATAWAACFDSATGR